MRWLLVVCGVSGAMVFPGAAYPLPISLSTTSGVMLGGVKELVLSSGYTVSELDWPLLPAFYAGLNLDVGETAGFLASVELQVGIPSYVGTMTDSDFLNGDGVKTHFSQADGDLENAVLLSAQAGWGIPFDLPGGGTGTFEPFAAFEFIRFEWTAQNGYLQYPPETSPPFTPWSPSTPKTPVYGTGIIYSQNYLIPALGVKGAFSLTKALSMSASFILSPYLWCFDKDSHLFRQLDFYSSMHSGLLLEPRLSASYRFSPATAISLDVVYRHIAQLIGDTYEVGTGASGYTQISQLAPGQQSVTFTNGAGASLDVLNVTVSVDLGL
ncbi:MAG: omptin family outer membrane protease [Spirochaetia bacterium]